MVRFYGHSLFGRPSGGRSLFVLRFYGHCLFGRPSGGAIVLFCVFTGIVFSVGPPGAMFFVFRFYRHSLFGRPFGDPIFRCTTKDRGERRASSSQAPHPSFCLSGQKLSRSAAPPLPTKPTSLGFGGAPIGGPLNPRGNVLEDSDVLCANRLAMVRVTRLSRAWRAPHCFHALCVLRGRLN